MSAITLNIASLVNEPAPLYRRYPRQTSPQPAHVEIDEDGTVSADYSGEIGYAVPMCVWHSRTLRVPVSCYVSGQALTDYLQDADTLALLQRIHDGHSVNWDGSNHVGELDGDATAALNDLERALDDLGRDESALVVVWDAGELLWATSLDQNWSHDQTLDDAVESLKCLAAAEDFVIDGDVRGELLSMAESYMDRGKAVGATHLAALVADERITQQQADEYEPH